MRPLFLLLTVGGLGHLRPASGTWGSTPPPAIVLALLWFLPSYGWLVNAALILLIVVFSAACVIGGFAAEDRFGSKDPSQVVADEVAGQAVALLFLPWQTLYAPGPAAMRNDIILAAVAFFAFRGFDIVKPPPANGLQRLPGGWGILIDDLLAGVYALIVAQLVARVVM